MSASVDIGAAAAYGTWAFLLVTDGSLVQSTPSKQLFEKRLNGRYALIGSATSKNRAKRTDNIPELAKNFVASKYPARFSELDIAKVLHHYPVNIIMESSNAVKFATNGVSKPSALDHSSVATGQRQRANVHAYGYLGPFGKLAILRHRITTGPDADMGNFVTQRNPSIPASVAVGSYASNGTSITKAATQWPAFSFAEPYLVNLDQTGGQLI
ncbi:hypothetical protein CFE70_000012 [Pyrenophora teres f. teres 0-1]